MDYNKWTVPLTYEAWKNGYRPVKEGWILYCRICGEHIGPMGCTRIKCCRKCGTKINWN